MRFGFEPHRAGANRPPEFIQPLQRSLRGRRGGCQHADSVDEQIGAANVERLAKEALGGAETKEAVAEQLLARLHREVRDTGVEFGEAALIPRTPTETLTRKYGDCKDQATLLIALLREAGVEAHVALLSTGPGPDVERELPGLGAFDHAIVYVLGKPPLWIDPT
ncbi:MAG: transglutaminase family protein, partial [Pedosphaera parvula]|nr:transglutaminase family protein [Pedosphaera parvula]